MNCDDEETKATKEKIYNKELNDLEKLKWERDYYKLRFEELNKHWNNIIHKILGENYYNMGCSWNICDDLAEEDLIYEYNHTNGFKRLIKRIKKYLREVLDK